MTTATPVYLNACSCGLPSKPTLARAKRYIAREEAVGPVRAFDEVREEFDAIPDLVSRLIGAPRDRIGFAATTTAAWLNVVLRLDLAGRRILVAPHEWGPNVRVLKAIAQATGAALETLPDPTDEEGISAWADAIDDDVAAIFAPVVSSIEGRRYPVKDIAHLPRPEGCRLILDGAQAIGQVEIDLSQIPCDAFVATARKWLRAPRGTAVWWAKSDLGLAPAEPGYEPTEMTVAARLALGVAAREALEDGVSERASQIVALRDRISAALNDRHYRVLHGCTPMTGTVTFAVPNVQAASVRAALADAGIIVNFPDPVQDEPLAGRDPNSVAMRLSPHVYTTEADIERLWAALPNCA